MNIDAKRLIQMAFKYANHYDIINHKKQGVLTVRFWLSNCEFLSVTTKDTLDPGTVYVRYGWQSNSSYQASTRSTQLDKLFGRSKRESYKGFAIVSMEKVLDVVQSLDYSQTGVNTIKIERDYVTSPEGMFW